MIRNLTGINLIINNVTYAQDAVLVKEPQRNLLVSGDADGIVLRRATFGKTTNLPDEVPGTFLIVLPNVAFANPTRTDLLFPDYGSLATRDATGKVVSFGSLMQV